jgi:hypothetical protein
VEADETVIGGKKRNRAFAKRAPKKHSVMTLVERDGHSYSFHIANVTAKSLRPLIVKIVSRHSRLMTDEGKWYIRLGEEFASHETVNRRPTISFLSSRSFVSLMFATIDGSLA